MFKTIRNSVLILTLLLPCYSYAQKTCCWRSIVTLPVPMPEGEVYDYGGIVAAGFQSHLIVPHIIDRRCPKVGFISYTGSIELDDMVDRIGEIAGVKPDLTVQKLKEMMHGVTSDYLFLGTVSVDNAVNINGKIFGQFTLNMKLIDNCPSRFDIVKEGQASWDGSNHIIAGEGGIAGRVSEPAIEAMAAKFMPVNDIIYEYERIPEHCEIVPEKDPVKVGGQITINLENIVDGQNRPSKSWQRVLVKVKEGEILNGVKQDSGHYVFEVGNGSVVMQYKAPTECPETKTDTIIVENTCNICPETVENFLPDYEIARKEIGITCVNKLEIQKCLEGVGCTYQKPCKVTVPFETRCQDKSGLCEIEGKGSAQVPYKIIYGGNCFTGTFGAEIVGGRLDFEKDPDHPLSLTLKIWRDNEVHFMPSCENPILTLPRGERAQMDMTLYSWPLVDGYSKRIGVFKYTLHLDTKTPHHSAGK